MFDGGRFVVTGGAGFLGHHLAGALLDRGASRVTAVDNLSTGRQANLGGLSGRPGFRFLHHDITRYVYVPGRVDAVLHFASPASPPDYLRLPIQTLKVGAFGTQNALGIARAKGARFLLASTSEVYGDPQIHPQPETYWGHVNPIGPRSVYDEAKRYAEALTYAYQRQNDVDVRVVRIFNTYGPGMRPDDGRAVPTFIAQALRGEPLTLHGGGSQTRSLCYVDDLVGGILDLLASDYDAGPVNLGNAHEVTVRELAETIIAICRSSSTLVDVPRPTDDPEQRRPDLTLARQIFGWNPQTPLAAGLAATVAGFC